MANGSAPLVLGNATRRIPKATYTPLNVPVADSVGGRAVLKFGYVGQLTLQPGETVAVKTQLSTQKTSTAAKTSTALPWKTLQQFEGAKLPSQLPAPSVFAKVPASALLAFGKVVAALRQKSLTELQQQASSAAAVPAAGAPAAAGAEAVAKVVPTKPGRGRAIRAARALSPAASPVSSSALGQARTLVNTASVAANAFEANVTATPIGYLALERLEMTPAGVERGELLATIPLAPREQTAVEQKEWSFATKEFSSIVAYSTDNYSEQAVTDNTDLSQSTTSQTQHSNQSNVNATVSGAIPFVSSSTVSTGFTSQDSGSQSATDSRKHAVETTRKASARVKQEHKMSISTTTTTGSSQSSTRILQNPSDTDPMRVDYFSLMQKWRVQLYRYGTRLTYDIAIPEPGAALREAYMKLDDLQSQAAQAFTFPLKYSDITLANYNNQSSTLWSYAGQWGAQVPLPPAQVGPLTVGGNPVTAIDPNHIDKLAVWPLNFTVPDGYWITDVTIKGYVPIMPEPQGGLVQFWEPFQVYIVGYGAINLDANRDPEVSTDLAGFMTHATGSQIITSLFTMAINPVVTFFVQLEPTSAAIHQWQSSVWNSLYNAAQAAFYAQQQAINSQIQALQDKINNVDTLTLRREENDEIMKGVLRWLLGPSFDFMPQEVIDLFGIGLDVSLGTQSLNITTAGTQAYDRLIHGVSFTGNDLVQPLGLPLGPVMNLPFSSADWTTMFQYREMVKFINEAIEWENVLYFLYSYFWDVPVSWDFIRQIQHKDAIRQAFLRAGSARVVLTVRKGWETPWINFVEAGGFGQTLLPGHPYLPIANEIQAYDDTNYPGIPPANPASDSALSDADSVATTSSAKVGPSAGPVAIPVGSSAGFVVGYTAVIDTYESGVQEAQVIVGIPDATHITVAAPPQPPGLPALKYAHDGTTTPFPVLQPGEKGQLIAQWYEYTPTSGTDIAVTVSDPANPRLPVPAQQ